MVVVVPVKKKRKLSTQCVQFEVYYGEDEDSEAAKLLVAEDERKLQQETPQDCALKAYRLNDVIEKLNANLDTNIEVVTVAEGITSTSS